MIREAAEELNGSRPFVRAEIVLTGYARYIHRGGKPEFFGLARIAEPFASLKVKPTGVESRWVRGLEPRRLLGSTNDDLLDGVEKLIAEFEGETPRTAGISLMVALWFARDYLRSRGP